MREIYMINYIIRIIALIMVMPVVALADQSGVTGIGGLASVFVDPVNTVTGFLSISSFIIGATCLFSGLLRFFQYRINPLANPLSTVITLFIIGTLLIIFPFFFDIIATEV